MIKAIIRYNEFRFRRPTITSRGILLKKPVYFILLYDSSVPFTYGIGECTLFPGLSMDDVAGFHKKIQEITELINKGWFNLKTPLYSYPSISFAIETAMKDLEQKGSKILYPSLFTEGKDSITIIGLIWMGTALEMNIQIDQLL